MHILDTDTLTHLLAGHEGVARRLALVPDTNIATTVVTQIELFRGRFDFVLKAASGAEMVRAQQLRERVIKAGDALVATRRALLSKPRRRAGARAAPRDRIRAAS